MAYTIYFGYLPKSSLIVDRSTNIVVDTDLANLYNFEVSQISFTQNGGASFIIPQTQHKIDHMAFACYNAFFIKTMNYDDDGVYHGYSITTYDITNISYTQATNVKITGILSPYNLALSMSYDSGGENSYMQFSTNLRGLNGYIERGYCASSIINPLNQKVNFSSTKSTDLYCLPPFNITKDIFKGSTKAKYDIAQGSSFTATTKARANNVFANCLWEISYILNTVTYTKSDGSDPLTIAYTGTQQKANSNAYIDLPYFVICKPISPEPINNGGTYIYKIYSPIEQDYVVWGDEYDIIVNAYKPYVLSKQISFLPPFIMDDPSDNITFEDSGTLHTMKFDFSATNVWAKDQDYRHYNAFDNTDVSNCIKVKLFPEVYDGEFDLTALSGLYLAPWSRTYTANELADIDNNPYVNLHTQELRLSDNQGNNYIYPLVNLGHFSELHVKTYVGYNLGNMYTYSVIDPYYLTNSVLNNYMAQDYRGLFNSFNNCILYNQDLLQEYIAQNKNFYNVRDLETSTYSEKWFYKSILSVGVNMITENIIGTLGSLLASYGGYLDYNTKITKENYQLNNLQSAPDSVKGGNNDTLFYSNNRKMGIYLDLYISDEITKKDIFEDFIKYGIYINRRVSDSNLPAYLTITNNAFDRLNIKYFKGNITLRPYDSRNYQYNYLCVDTCLRKLEKDLSNGAYVFKDSNADFKPYKSDSELNIFSTYLNNNLFRGV